MKQLGLTALVLAIGVAAAPRAQAEQPETFVCRDGRAVTSTYERACDRHGGVNWEMTRRVRRDALDARYNNRGIYQGAAGTRGVYNGEVNGGTRGVYSGAVNGGTRGVYSGEVNGGTRGVYNGGVYNSTGTRGVYGGGANNSTVNGSGRWNAAPSASPQINRRVDDRRDDGRHRDKDHDHDGDHDRR